MVDYLLYLVVMAVTPGPNTILSMANAASVGLERGIRLNFGMLAGITIVTALAFTAVQFLYTFLPQAQRVMRLFAFAYLIYLALKNLMISMREEDAAGCGFIKGLVLQLVNVKVYLLAITAQSAYIMPMADTLAGRIALSALIPIVCFAAGLVWAIGGSLLKEAFSRHRKLFGLIFCLSLVWCAIRMVLG